MAETEPSQITRYLTAAAGGSDADRSRLLDLIYDELRAVAGNAMRSERADHTLQPTALVHEAFFRLFGAGGAPFENRAHLFGAAAEAMRRILVDHARRRAAQKRGGGDPVRKVALTEVDEECAAPPTAPEELLAIDDALQALEASDPRKATIVKLRYYAGLTVEEVAVTLAISEITVKRDWRFARAWLMTRLEGDSNGPMES